MASGIYTLLPLAKRVTSKIENIIREEMNNIDSQEILMPLVATKNYGICQEGMIVSVLNF